MYCDIGAPQAKAGPAKAGRGGDGNRDIIAGGGPAGLPAPVPERRRGGLRGAGNGTKKLQLRPVPRSCQEYSGCFQKTPASKVTTRNWPPPSPTRGADRRTMSS